MIINIVMNQLRRTRLTGVWFLFVYYRDWSNAAASIFLFVAIDVQRQNTHTPTHRLLVVRRKKAWSKIHRSFHRLTPLSSILVRGVSYTREIHSSNWERERPSENRTDITSLLMYSASNSILNSLIFFSSLACRYGCGECLFHECDDRESQS